MPIFLLNKASTKKGQATTGPNCLRIISKNLRESKEKMRFNNTSHLSRNLNSDIFFIC